MKNFRLINSYITFLAISFLLLPSHLHATDRQAYISQEELHEILDNTDMRYVHLGREFSQLYEVISLINELEDNKESLLYELKKHIDDGFSIGLHSAVLDTLECAQRTLEQVAEDLNPQDVQVIEQVLDTVINQVVNDALTVSATNTPGAVSTLNSKLADMDDNAAIYRCGSNQGCPPASSCCAPTECRVVKVREKLDVLQNARFRKNVEIDGKLKVYGKSTFKDKVKFDDDVEFEDDVLIEGDLTVDGTVTFNGPISGLTIIDVVIETLSATDIVVVNLSATDAFIQNLSVVDLTVLSCMDHLCVNNLSVTNEVVQNLSAIDATIQTLSATDAVIQNLSVTDLVVLSCMDSLCVNNLSVGDIVFLSCLDTLCVNHLSAVDAVITGTLSVTNEIAQNLTAVNFSATDAVIQNLSVTDLVVLSCMDSLCVNNLSVGDITILSCLDSLCVLSLSAVDEVITGTLSVTNEFAVNLSVTNATIDNLTVTNCIPELCVVDLSVTDIFAGSLSLCDLIVSCDIFMNNSTSPAIGNIMKNGNRFIHNFGTDNTFVGVNSGNFTTGGAENVGIGRNALFSNTTGFDDTAVGAFSMNTNTIGANNAAYGSFSLVNNTTGNANVALGNFSLATNTTGSGNTAVGFQSAFNLGVGSNNVFVGNNAGVTLTNGFTNVILGFNSGLSLTTGNDNIYVSNAGVPTESGAIRIGTSPTHTAAFIQGIFGTAVGGTGIGVFVDASGQLGTVVSSQRFKHDIEDMGYDSENIYQLRPVTFVYNEDATNTKQYGLIAEETDVVFPPLVVHDEEGQPYTVRYHLLPVLLLNEIQKLKGTIDDQGFAIEQLQLDNLMIREAMVKMMERLSFYSE